MITRDDMFIPVVRADPTFGPTCENFLREWREEPEAPQYLLLADLARHLIGQLALGDSSRFDAVFDVVERWHIEGDQHVREAATVGLLEDLQNLNLHMTTKPEQFIRWLRPTSRRYWDKIEAFWRDGTIITDD